MSFGKFFNLFVLPFHISTIGIITASTSWVVRRIKRVNNSEVLRTVPDIIHTMYLLPSQDILHLLSEQNISKSGSIQRLYQLPSKDYTIPSNIRKDSNLIKKEANLILS